MATHIRQGIRLKAKNKKAKYKLKYTLAQTVKTRKGRQVTKYTYSKDITPKKKKYSYS